MVKIVLISYNSASVRMRNPVGMHEAGLSKFTHYLRGKLSSASKENLKQALDTPPGDKGGIYLWTLPKNQLIGSGNDHYRPMLLFLPRQV
jgi:hypothetical protein